MIVLDLTYINENSKVEQLVQYSVGTVAQQEEVTRAANYVENKIFLDIDKEIFYDSETDDYIFTDDFMFLTLNLLECFWITKDIMADMATKKGQTKKVDDVSEAVTWKDSSDVFKYRGIPCDEDTIASLMGYSQSYLPWTMTIDLQ